MIKICKQCRKEYKTSHKNQMFCCRECKEEFFHKKNEIIIYDDYAELIIDTKCNKLKVKISKEDIEKVSQIRWYARFDGYNYYFDGWNRKTKKVEKLHRYILECPIGYVVDHINTNDHLDNRRENLRICTQYENIQNQKTRKNSSGYKYIIWHKQSQKWDFSINKDKKRITIARNKNLNEIIKIRDDYLKSKEYSYEKINRNSTKIKSQ